VTGKRARVLPRGFGLSIVLSPLFSKRDPGVIVFY